MRIENIRSTINCINTINEKLKNEKLTSNNIRKCFSDLNIKTIKEIYGDKGERFLTVLFNIFIVIMFITKLWNNNIKEKIRIFTK